MSEPVLDAVGIVKYLGRGAGQVQALKGVNLSLRGGELVLLMGPSGKRQDDAAVDSRDA